MKRRFERVAGRLVSFEEEDELVPEPLRSVRRLWAEGPHDASVFDRLVEEVADHVRLLVPQGSDARSVAAVPVEWWSGISSSGVDSDSWLLWMHEVFSKCGLESPIVADGSHCVAAYAVHFNKTILQCVDEVLGPPSWPVHEGVWKDIIPVQFPRPRYHFRPGFGYHVRSANRGLA